MAERSPMRPYAADVPPRGLTQSQIGRQVVITVGSVTIESDSPAARFEDALALVLKKLEPYKPDPKPLAVWSLGHATVGVIQLEIAPPTGALNPLPLPLQITMEPNMLMGSSSVPHDTYYDEQWGLRKMSAELAWSCAEMNGTPGPVTVAVVDSGISRAHPDLTTMSTPRITGARVTQVNPDGEIEDEDGHGTFLAGTIAALTDNTIGVASPTWTVQDVLTIMAVKFYDPRTPMSSAFAARAIAWAVDNHADIINASFHIGMSSQVLLDAVQYASDNDVVFVAAAGNDGTDNDTLPTWPASYPLPNVISVMASNRHDDKPGFSNYGPSTVHLAAPGVGIWSTHHYFYAVNDPKYRRYSGTSASCAYVAAAAAMLRSFSPGLTASDIKEHLIKSVRVSEYFKCVAQGWLDLERAICGPLRLTAPLAGQVWTKNTSVEVQWQTDYDTPACKRVNILLSDDEGVTYKYTLATNVDSSTGSRLVQLPNKVIPQARIRLETQPGRFPVVSGRFKIKN